MGRECCVIPAGKKYKRGRKQASAMPMIFVTRVQSIWIFFFFEKSKDISIMDSVDGQDCLLVG